MHPRLETQEDTGPAARARSRRGAARGRQGLAVLELFCGIGGCAAALAARGRVVAALDINRPALGVYSRNFPHPTRVRTLDSLTARDLAGFAADLWWMSPPCQPFTRRGLGRDDGDPRSRPLLHLMDCIAEVRPRYVALENVPGFATSRTRERLLEILEASGYEVRERILCPSELGWPNRRRRYYLVAGRRGLAPARLVIGRPVLACGRSSREEAARDCPSVGRGGELRPDRGAGPAIVPAGDEARLSPGDGPAPTEVLARFLDPFPSPELRVPPELLERYRGALDLVRADDPEAVTACFTSAYGRSPVRSGSYLLDPAGVRRFSPAEILRLLGFPPGYSLPPELPLAKAWPLVGASLPVPAAREVLAAVPELADLAELSSRPTSWASASHETGCLAPS